MPSSRAPASDPRPRAAALSRRRPRHRALVVAAAAAAVTLLGIPAAAATTGGAAVGSPGGRGSYIVRPGDTVPAVARRTGVSADDLRVANGIVGDRLYVGARLVIDPGAAGGRAAGTTATARPSGGGTYVVRSGDALSTIARRHGVSLSALLSANGLRTTSLIMPGRRLVIPGAGTPAMRTISATTGTPSSRGSGPVIRCPVPGASFMNDWGFPRGTTRFHEGTDMFAPRGTPVRAPLTGQLTFGSNGLGGRTFTITSPTGWVAYGAHLNGTVGSSRWVAAGEVIATVGNSGNAAGGATHLHLGLRLGPAPSVNPYPSVAAAC